MQTRIVLSTALIVFGSLCVTAVLAAEAIRYPWASGGPETVNGIELPDPPPPNVDYIDYIDYLDSEPSPEASPPGVPEILILPGDDSGTEAIYAVADAAEPTPRNEPRAPAYVRLGTIKLPRLNISENLFAGTGTQLRHGVGHLEGTPLPGEDGNAVLAAHRASASGKHPFRHLDKMQNGDIITIGILDETFRYEVFDQFIVHKSEVWVLGPVKGDAHTLTLVTCDPVVTLTPRYNRLIVRARLEQ
jgi:sortase A